MLACGKFNKKNAYIIKLLLFIIITHQVHAAMLPKPSDKLAEASNTPQTISFFEALERSLNHDLALKLAHNNLELAQTKKISRVAMLLPKIRGNMRYSKNIPKSKIIIAAPNDHLALVSRKVATLLSAAGDRPSADLLEGAADQMLRRVISDEIVSRPEQAIEGTFSVIVPLFNALDIAQLVSSDDNIKLEEALLNQQRAETLYSAALSYMQAFHYQELLNLRARQSEAALHEHQKLLRRFKHNVVSDVQILKSEHAYEELKLAALSIQREYDQALSDLGFLIGEKSAFMLGTPSSELFSPLEHSEEDLIAFARKNRPDLRAQEKSLWIAEHERLGSILQFVPNIFFQADANYTSNTKGFVNKPINYTIFINASYDFFNGGSTIGALKESFLRKQSQKLRLDHLEQKIAAQIRGRRATIERNLLAIKTQQSLISYAVKSEAGALSRYTRGQANLDNFLDSRSIKFSAEVALSNAESDLKTERLALAYELGLLTPKSISINSN